MSRSVIQCSVFCHQRSWCLFSWNTEMRWIFIKAIIHCSIIVLSPKGLFCFPLFWKSWLVFALFIVVSSFLNLIMIQTSSTMTSRWKYAWLSPENVILKARWVVRFEKPCAIQHEDNFILPATFLSASLEKLAVKLLAHSVSNEFTGTNG